MKIFWRVLNIVHNFGKPIRLISYKRPMFHKTSSEVNVEITYNVLPRGYFTLSDLGADSGEGER
jgi:hypothetical protein